MRRGFQTSAALAATTIVLAGCGGGERQDANEPSGTYALEVVDASFPESQSLAADSEMVIKVRNADSKAAPVVAVTVDSFSKDSEQPGLADPSRPVWVIDEAPVGGQTAYTNTWALGELGPGQTKTFRWKVTPVQAGTHEVKYKVAAGLDGKAKTASELAGSFTVAISGKPADATVDPDTGKVVRGSSAD
ncbi:hypothetical protein [Paraconexibacter sp.]|uniref:hypothetical protein n=1 Tax=Paraconexibacter sp. TaxID=2949640 RepID=UPI0035695496